MVAIIDADSIVWTAAYLGKDNPSMIIPNLDAFLHDMLRNLGATHYTGFLGGSEPTERKLMSSTYKSSRPGKPDFYTQHSKAIIHQLVDRWKFEVVEGIEADDAVSIQANSCRVKSQAHTICAIDKDLKQIPGMHYNYKTKELATVTEEEADYNLFVQILMGDSTDSIPGLAGVGPVKAKKILAQASTIRTGEVDTITVENPEYVKVIQAYCNQLGIREGLAKFSETYLLVRLATGGREFKLIEYKH